MVVVHYGVLILLIVVYRTARCPALGFPDHQALLNYSVKSNFDNSYLFFDWTRYILDFIILVEPFVFRLCSQSTTTSLIILLIMLIIYLKSIRHSHISIRFVFRPIRRLSDFFTFKDRIPFAMRSHVVYKYKCQFWVAHCMLLKHLQILSYHVYIDMFIHCIYISILRLRFPPAQQSWYFNCHYSGMIKGGQTSCLVFNNELQIKVWNFMAWEK